MQKVARYCDRPKGRGNAKCEERVPNDEPTKFSLNGVGYNLDLCAEHQEELAKVLTPYLDNAELTTVKNGNSVRKAIRAQGNRAFTTRDVREWLRQQGREVSESGRISKDLIEEYAASQAAN